MVEGRSAEAVAKFVPGRATIAAKAEAITSGHGHEPGLHHRGAGQLANARIVFDLFPCCCMKLAGEALDAVRRPAQAGADLTGETGRSGATNERVLRSNLICARTLARTYPKLGGAIALREALQRSWPMEVCPSICRWWLGWADHSRLEPSPQTFPTLRGSTHGILAYLELPA